jgi:carboxymethylenebutenolidase
MSLKTEVIKYEDQIGYLASPEKAVKPLPAIIVIAEAWGLNENIEDITRRIAAAGYTALAPDLFAVNGVRPQALSRERIGKAVDFMRKLPAGSFGDMAAREAELAKLPQRDREEISETFGLMFSGPAIFPKYIGNLRKAVKQLRKELEESKGQKVACVGFCMGGGLSALLACEEPELSGAAVFYGNTPPLEKIPNIKCPVIAFYGANDQRVNAGIKSFEETMKREGKSYEYHIYEGAGHGFFNDTHAGYEVRASRDSFARLLTFFSKVTAV